MASDYRRRFFEGVRKHSQIKLRAVERYLRPWAAKVGSGRGVKRIWVIDGFAGAGMYESGELGSPALALREAAYVRDNGRKYQLACFFCEPDPSNHRSLLKLTRYEPEAHVARQNFWTQIQVVADLVGQDPALVFVDPFGLADLKFDPLVDLCNRLRRIDLIVNLATPAASRLAVERSELIDDAVGGPGWTLETLADTFCDRLAKRGRLMRPARLPVEAGQ